MREPAPLDLYRRVSSRNVGKIELAHSASQDHLPRHWHKQITICDREEARNKLGETERRSRYQKERDAIGLMRSAEEKLETLQNPTPLVVQARRVESVERDHVVQRRHARVLGLVECPHQVAIGRVHQHLVAVGRV